MTIKIDKRLAHYSFDELAEFFCPYSSDLYRYLWNDCVPLLEEAFDKQVEALGYESVEAWKEAGNTPSDMSCMAEDHQELIWKQIPDHRKIEINNLVNSEDYIAMKSRWDFEEEDLDVHPIDNSSKGDL